MDLDPETEKNLSAFGVTVQRYVALVEIARAVLGADKMTSVASVVVEAQSTDGPLRLSLRRAAARALGDTWGSALALPDEPEPVLAEGWEAQVTTYAAEMLAKAARGLAPTRGSYPAETVADLAMALVAARREVERLRAAR